MMKGGWYSARLAWHRLLGCRGVSFPRSVDPGQVSFFPTLLQCSLNSQHGHFDLFIIRNTQNFFLLRPDGQERKQLPVIAKVSSPLSICWLALFSLSGCLSPWSHLHLSPSYDVLDVFYWCWFVANSNLTIKWFHQAHALTQVMYYLFGGGFNSGFSYRC